jgi:hypothetical protein
MEYQICEYIYKMKYPIFTGRKGSKCYFTYDKNFFNANEEKCLKLISFYTLYLFGHQENKDNVLIATKNCFKKVSFERCMKLLFNDKLRNRIFHLSNTQDKKLMGCFNGEVLVTDEIITSATLKACKTLRIHDEYPCMFDKFKVGSKKCDKMIYFITFFEAFSIHALR